MHKIQNPYYGTAGLHIGDITPHTFLEDLDRVQTLLKRCPVYVATPLLEEKALAQQLGIGSLWVKDETKRMGMGSFKALGAAYAIAKDAMSVIQPDDDHASALAGVTYVCASAGNHGLSVAAGARIFGAKAVIYVSENVDEQFVTRIKQKGAAVVITGTDYDASMAAAREAAAQNGWRLLSDSTWDGYTEPAIAVMQGYQQMAVEIVQQLPRMPTHIYLQAGVGGMAASVAAYFRAAWGSAPKIIIVEPQYAACLLNSIEAGKPVYAAGAASRMGRLDCKEPSYVALASLSITANEFCTITEAEARNIVFSVYPAIGRGFTASAMAGLAGLIADETARGEAVHALVIETEEFSM